jgi:hypothetical protein
MDLPLSLVAGGAEPGAGAPRVSPTGAGADAVVRHVAPLLEALAGAGLPVPQPGAARPGPGAPSLHLDCGATALPAGSRVWSVRGLPGILRAVHAHLDVEIVEVPAEPADAEEDRGPTAEALARRFRGRVHVVGDPEPLPPGTAGAAARTGGEAAPSRALLPETLAGLVERPDAWELILAPEGSGAPLAHTAAALAGVRALLCAVHVGGDAVHAELPPRPDDPCAIVPGLAGLLRAAGFGRAGTALLDAWYCALEERLHPPGLPILALEARRRRPDAFVADVAERVGLVPRSLAPAEDRWPSNRPPRLRVV